MEISFEEYRVHCAAADAEISTCGQYEKSLSDAERRCNDIVKWEGGQGRTCILSFLIGSAFSVLPILVADEDIDRMTRVDWQEQKYRLLVK